MKIKDIIYIYGNWGVASRELKMGCSTMQRWKTLGYIPIQTQYRVEYVARHRMLKADLKDCIEQFAKYKR